MSHALLVIDVQNDYFPGGALPQWQVEETTARIAAAIRQADSQGWLIVAVQHIATDENARLFNPKGEGIALHASVASLLQGRPLIVKQQADAFLNTELARILSGAGITHLHLCGMMTQNCITHTALSPEAAPYQVHILSDCCTATTELIHQIALRGLGGRHQVGPASAAFPAA